MMSRKKFDESYSLLRLSHVFFFWIVIVLTTLNAEILEWDNDAKIAPTGHQTQAT